MEWLPAACPWCDNPSGVVCGWDTLGRDDLSCQACGKPIEVEFEENWDGYMFWLTRRNVTKEAGG